MTYGEKARGGIKSNMHLMDEICRVAHAAKGAPRINLVLPSIQFFVPFHREIVPFISRLEKQAVGFQVCAFDIRQITELNDTLRRCCLIRECVSLIRDALFKIARETKVI